MPGAFLELIAGDKRRIDVFRGVFIKLDFRKVGFVGFCDGVT